MGRWCQTRCHLGQSRPREERDVSPGPGEGRTTFPPWEERGGLQHRATRCSTGTEDPRAERGDRKRLYHLLRLRGSTPRIQVDKRGPEQRYAIGEIDIAKRLLRNNCTTLRWTPAYQGVEGNEVANQWAKAAAESVLCSAQKTILREMSLAFVSRSITEAKTNDTGEDGFHDNHCTGVILGAINLGL